MQYTVQVRSLQYLDLSGLWDAPSVQEQDDKYELVSVLLFDGGSNLQTARFPVHTKVAGGAWFHFSNGEVQ